MTPWRRHPWMFGAAGGAAAALLGLAVHAGLWPTLLLGVSCAAGSAGSGLLIERLGALRLLAEFRKSVLQGGDGRGIIQAIGKALLDRFRFKTLLFEVSDAPNEPAYFILSSNDGMRPLDREAFQAALRREPCATEPLIRDAHAFCSLHVSEDRMRRLDPRGRAAFDEILGHGKLALERELLQKERGKLVDKLSDMIVEYQEQVAQQREMNKQLQKNLKEISAIYQVASSVLNTLDLDLLLQDILASIVRSFNVSFCFIMLVKEGSEDLVIKACHGIPLEEVSPIAVPKSRGITQEVLRTGRTLCVGDVREHPAYFPFVPDIRSELAIPLMAGGKAIGVLDIESPQRHAFHPEDVDLLSSVATHVGMAIAQASLVSQLELAKDEIKRTFLNSIKALSTAIEAKDRYTRGHVERTATYALELGAWVGLEKERLESLYMAAILHDVGKIGIPEVILNKKESLTEEERRIIENHPTIGVDILKDFLEVIIPGVLYHHSWYGGGREGVPSGYPQELAGEAIPMEARIISIVDAFDAMTSHRPYRTALSREEAVSRLIAGKGEQFDPALVDAFLEIINKSKVS